jgi:undecaprenyl-diphosphatase
LRHASARTTAAKAISSRKARSARLAAIAAVALALYAALGSAVSWRPPSAFDLAGQALLGHGLAFAYVAYRSGLFQTYAVLCVITIVAAIFLPRWRGRVAFAIGALLLTWIISDRFKDLFHRPRPDHWLLVHETSASYSSGHSALGLAFCGLWALMIWLSDLPLAVRIAVSGLLFAWSVAIDWSRLAMGAHFPTDIIGGWLLALAVVCGLRAATLVVEAKEPRLE